jgi:hypothetical protein
MREEPLRPSWIVPFERKSAKGPSSAQKMKCRPSAVEGLIQADRLSASKRFRFVLGPAGMVTASRSPANSRA